MADIAYFDTCIFIELLQKGNKKRFDACDDLRKKAEREELVIVTSTTSLAEVNKLSNQQALREDESKTILAFFRNAYISLRGLDREVGEYAHELTRTHGLMPFDAVHVATAVLNRVPVLYTYDSKKHRRKGLLAHSGMIGKPAIPH